MSRRSALVLVTLFATCAVHAQETPGAAPAAPPMDGGIEISAAFPFESKYVEILGSRMHYVEKGSGDPILFVHGNPTSSYLWRNVIPHLSGQGRCIAIDLIGMGKSDKPDIGYTFADHVRYFEGFIAAMQLKNVTLVLHDWGTGLGFHYATRRRDNVKAIAFMEGVIRTWDSARDMNPAVAPFFMQFRTPGIGEKLLLENNMFVEQLLPGGVLRPLRPEEMEYYRAPYPDPASRKPLWVWPNEIPLGGKPANVHEAVEAYRAGLQEWDVPKLLAYVSPGILMGADTAAWCKEKLPNLTAVDLGEGLHYMQEDYPHTLGKALSEWHAKL